VTQARDEIFAGIRRALRRGPIDPAAAEKLRARIAAHRRNLIPERAASRGHAAQVELFVTMAEEVQTTVERVSSLAAVPDAVARYLSGENLPAVLVAAPDPGLDVIPWQTRPLLRVRRGRAEAEDRVSLTPAFAAIAETGTLMLISGPDTPTTLNFLPDTHLIVLHEDQVVATYEDGWDRLRAHAAAIGGLPRTVNFITGPSRTGDIEQRLELGAHGPRRLHILLVAGEARAENDEDLESG
jgi:L-lactate dehydrogenase complex protein LldG